MQNGNAFKRLPNTHKKKTRFGIRVKGPRNLGLNKGAEQCFIFWNGLRGRATGMARSLSWLVT